MKKNKTKSILACAVLASVLGAAAPVWADEVGGENRVVVTILPLKTILNPVLVDRIGFVETPYFLSPSDWFVSGFVGSPQMNLDSSIFNPDGSTLILDNVGNITVTGKSADSRAVLTMSNGSLSYLNFADNGGITMNIDDDMPEGQFNYYVAEGRDNSLTVLKNLDSVTINGSSVTVDVDFWKCLKTADGAQIVVVDGSGNVVAADVQHWGTGPKYGKEIDHFYRTIANETKDNVQSMTALGFDDKNVVALKANKADASANFISPNGSLRSVNFDTGNAYAVSVKNNNTAKLKKVTDITVNATNGKASVLQGKGGKIVLKNFETANVSAKKAANFISVSGNNRVTVKGRDNWATVDVKSEKKDANFVFAKNGTNTVDVTGVDAMLYPGADGKAYMAHVKAGETTLNLKDSTVSGNLNTALVTPVAQMGYMGGKKYDPWGDYDGDGPSKYAEEFRESALNAMNTAAMQGGAQNSVQNLLDALDTALEAVQKAINSDGDLQKLIDTTRDALKKVEDDVNEMKELGENKEKVLNWVNYAQSELQFVQQDLDFYNSHTGLISVMAGGWQGWWLKIKAHLDNMVLPLQRAQTTVQTGTAEDVTQKSSYVLYQLAYYTPAYVQVEKGATLNLNLDNSLLQAGINSTEEHGTVNLTLQESNWVMQDDSNVDFLKMDNKSEVIFDRDSYKYLTLNVGNYEGNGNFILNTDVGYSGVTSDKLVIDKAEDGSALNLYLLAEDNPLTDPDTKAEILALGKDAEKLQINLIADNLPDNGLWRYALNTEKNNEGTNFNLSIKRGDELSTVGRAVTGGVIDTQVWYQESDAVFEHLDSTLNPDGSTLERNSVWASYTHSKNTYDNSIKAITSVANQGGIEKRYNGAVVGYDQCIATYPEHNAALYMGGLIGYGEGRNSWSGGNSELDGKGIGIYAGYKTHKGAYLTALAKYNQYDMDVKGYGYNEVKDDYRLHSFGVSLNAGRRYAKDLNKGFYLEPQAELGYVNYGNDNYELKGIKVEMQETKSCRGRLGLQFGTHNGRADVYGRVSYLKDFQGDSDIMTHYINGTRDSIKVEQGGHWWNFALGGTFTNGKNLSADVSLNLDRGDHDSKLGFRVGLNWAF